MALILNIDTSSETATVCLARDGIEVAIISNRNQKDHAVFLHGAIDHVLKKTDLKLHSLSAIAVANGPGSYTGLRVGMASAKGLCYALQKPLIAVGNLEILAAAALEMHALENKSALFCPLIDARRMEVYTSVFDNEMKQILKPKAMILDADSFGDILSSYQVLFFGSGSDKFARILRNTNAVFLTIEGLIQAQSKLSFKQYKTENFADLVDTEPLYVKSFHSSPDFTTKKIN